MTPECCHWIAGREQDGRYPRVGWWLAAGGASADAACHTHALLLGHTPSVATYCSQPHHLPNRPLLLRAVPPADSWGNTRMIYDMNSYYTDLMTYQNPDFVTVMAAGNYGDDQPSAVTTVTSPSTAKNCITVGATLNMRPNYVSQPSVKVWVMTMTVQREGHFPQRLTRRLVQAGEWRGSEGWGGGVCGWVWRGGGDTSSVQG